jgi:hypothetical protein
MNGLEFSQVLCRMPRRLCALAFAIFFFHGNEQFKADLGVTLEARRKFLLRLEGGLVREAVLRVRDLIDPRRRNHLARPVLRLAGIGSHALCPVASGT